MMWFYTVVLTLAAFPGQASRRAQREAYDAEAAEFDNDDLDHDNCCAAHTEAADLPSTSAAEAGEQPADGEAAASEQDETASLATSAPVFESNICLVTADFPMQVSFYNLQH